jgi:hypothetical protein
MRRIILLMTVATLVVVSTLLVVSASGAHKHPTAKAQKNPTRKVLIQNFRFQAGPHHHQAGDEGQMDQQGQRCPHRNGEQKDIVRLRTFG